MDDQEKMNQPTTSDDSFENYYLQDNSGYMNAGAKLKVVSNCQKEEEEIEEGEVISEKYDNPKCFSPEINQKRNQYSPASIIDFDMGSPPPAADTINGGDWKVKGKRSRRYIIEIRPKNYLQSRKLDKKSEAVQKEEKIRLKKRKIEEFAVEEKGDDFNGGKTAVAEDNHTENHLKSRKLDKESEAQKEEKIRLKKRKFEKFAVEEKGDDFNGRKTAVEDYHTEERNMEIPMKKKLMLKIKGLNQIQRADKSAGIVSLATDQKMDDQDNLKTYTTRSEADIIKRDADVNHNAVIPKKHKCNICGDSFASPQALGGHKSKHTVKVKMEGPFSNLKVQNKFKKQRETVGASDNQEIHGCNMCDKSYNSRRALLMHKRKHFEDDGGGGGGSKDQNFISPKRVLDFDLNEPCPELEID